MSKFKFGGHLRPFWLTDLTGRIKVFVARNDGIQTARTDVFYVEGSTVGQVAYAIEQALFAPEEGRPTPAVKLKEADCPIEVCTEGDREVFPIHRCLTADDLPALRQIVGRIERQERKRQQYQEAFNQPNSVKGSKKVGVEDIPALEATVESLKQQRQGEGYFTEQEATDEVKPIYGDCGGEEAYDKDGYPQDVSYPTSEPPEGSQ